MYIYTSLKLGFIFLSKWVTLLFVGDIKIETVDDLFAQSVYIGSDSQECSLNRRRLQCTLKILNLLELKTARGFSWKRVTRFERATFTLAR